MNATAAFVYIGAVAFFLHFTASVRHDTPDTLLDGMAFISLVVFSAAIMAFLIFYQPVVMLIEHTKAEAVSYFLKTVAIFGALTVLALTFASLQ